MRKIKVHEIILTLFVLLAIAVWVGYFQYRDDKLKVYFFNVGQGDSSMLVLPGAQEVLIDGGPDSNVMSEIGKAMPFFDREIELVILTHPHADHVVGLIDVLEHYKVDEVWLTNVDYESEPYSKFKRLVADKNIKTYSPQVGDIQRIGELKIQTLAPTEDYSGKKVENINNTSIVSKISYKDISFLMTGDAELDEQTEVLKNGFDLSSQVLKEPHHGSEKVSEDFINKVNAKVTIISCGKNNQYGFPNGQTLDKLKKISSEIFRTDEKGTIFFKTNGNLPLSAPSFL